MSKPITRSRTYDAPRRREQAAETRRLILGAARRLFERDGYAATSTAAIAKEAGVTPKTVFNAFETKAGLLRALWNRTLRGEDDEIPVRQRDWFREVIEEPDPERTLRLNARNSRRFKEDATDMLRLVRDAAPLEPEIAGLWERIQTEYRTNQREVVASLGRGALKPGLSVDRAADVLWTLNHPNTWLQLSVIRDWSPAQYERWVGDTSCELLLR
jgi:AcrR family transcriptional regulator